MPQVRIYETEDGRSPFAEWLASLRDKPLAKVASAIGRLQGGNPGDSKGVGGGVMERRIHHGPGLRVYYGRDGRNLVILLAGGTKKRQARDVADAKALWAEYRRRRDAGEALFPDDAPDGRDREADGPAPDDRDDQTPTRSPD